MRVETQMPRTFKNQTQHSKESFNVWANSSGYQDKLYFYMIHEALFYGTGRGADCVSDDMHTPFTSKTRCGDICDSLSAWN